MPLTSRQRKDIRTGLFFVSPWLIGFAVFLVYPIIASLYYSMTRFVGIGSPKWIGFWNYSFLIKDELFWTSLYNITYYLVFAVPLGFAVGLSLALIMNFRVKEKSIYRTIIYFPAILPMFASAFIWLWMFNPQLGIIN
ncbi:MAG: sugar ABC transporter permease, partial [bacterium]